MGICMNIGANIDAVIGVPLGVNMTQAGVLPPHTPYALRQSKQARAQAPKSWHKAGHLALALLIGWSALPANAQGVFRTVGPDGRVTFSDQPPSAESVRPPAGTSANNGTNASKAANPPLPFALRQAASRYPVTLYTSSGCAPCNTGRNLLNRRGVPYVEKTINTPQDAQAMLDMRGETTLPFLTIGSQQIKGFSDTEWTQYLDAADYPQQSALPSNYRRPPATPLVAVPADASAKALDTTNPAPERQSVTTPNEPAIPVTPAKANPSGIRF